MAGGSGSGSSCSEVGASLQAKQQFVDSRGSFIGELTAAAMHMELVCMPVHVVYEIFVCVIVQLLLHHQEEP